MSTGSPREELLKKLRLLKVAVGRDKENASSIAKFEYMSLEGELENTLTSGAKDEVLENALQEGMKRLLNLRKAKTKKEETPQSSETSKSRVRGDLLVKELENNPRAKTRGTSTETKTSDEETPTRSPTSIPKSPIKVETTPTTEVDDVEGARNRARAQLPNLQKAIEALERLKLEELDDKYRDYFQKAQATIKQIEKFSDSGKIDNLAKAVDQKWKSFLEDIKKLKEKKGSQDTQEPTKTGPTHEPKDTRGLEEACNRARNLLPKVEEALLTLARSEAEPLREEYLAQLGKAKSLIGQIEKVGDAQKIDLVVENITKTLSSFTEAEKVLREKLNQERLALESARNRARDLLPRLEEALEQLARAECAELRGGYQAFFQQTQASIRQIDKQPALSTINELVESCTKKLSLFAEDVKKVHEKLEAARNRVRELLPKVEQAIESLKRLEAEELTSKYLVPMQKVQSVIGQIHSVVDVLKIDGLVKTVTGSLSNFAQDEKKFRLALEEAQQRARNLLPKIREALEFLNRPNGEPLRGTYLGDFQKAQVTINEIAKQKVPSTIDGLVQTYNSKLSSFAEDVKKVREQEQAAWERARAILKRVEESIERLSRAKSPELTKTYAEELQKARSFITTIDTSGETAKKIDEFIDATTKKTVAVENDLKLLDEANQKAVAIVQRIDRLFKLAGKATDTKNLQKTLTSLKKQITDAQEQGGAKAILSAVGQVAKELPNIATAISSSNIRSQPESSLKTLAIEEQIDLLSGVATEVQRLKLKGESYEEVQKLCDKLYRVMPMDKKFKEKDQEQRRKYLGELEKDKKLSEASNPEKWKSLGPDEQVGLMQGALDKQYVTLIDGLKVGTPFDTPPKIEKLRWPDDASTKQIEESQQSGTKPQGYYTKHKIIFWIHADGPLRDFEEAFDTAIHETTHAYQHALVEELDKTITPGDWRYEQVQLFKLNNDAYNGGSDQEAYRNEPLEIHAWLAGNTASLLFNWDAKLLDLTNKKNRATKLYPEETTKFNAPWKAVESSGSDVTARGDAYVEVNNMSDSLIKKAQKVKESLKSEFDSAQNGISEVLKWINRTGYSLPKTVFEKYSKVFNTYSSHSETWNNGPVSSWVTSKSEMVNAKDELDSIVSALWESQRKSLKDELDAAIVKYPRRKTELEGIWKNATSALAAISESAVTKFEELKKQVQAILEEAKKAKLELEKAFNQEHEPAKELKKEAGQIVGFTGSAPVTLRDEVFKEYDQLVNTWDNGSVEQLSTCPSKMAGLKTKLANVKAALTEYNNVNEAFKGVTTNLNSLNLVNPFPSDYYEVYSKSFEHYKTLMKDRDQAGSDPKLLKKVTDAVLELKKTTGELLLKVK